MTYTDAMFDAQRLRQITERLTEAMMKGAHEEARKCVRLIAMYSNSLTEFFKEEDA